MRNRRNVLSRLIDTKKIPLTCILFTAATAADMAISLPAGITETSFFRLASRFVLCLIPVTALELFRRMERLPVFVICVFHFALSCCASIAWVWVTGRFAELHPDAYRDVFFSFSAMYAAVNLAVICFDAVRTARANRELAKLNRAPAQ